VTTSSVAHAFRDVDAEPSSTALSAYLAKVSEHVASAKAASYDLLEAREGARLLDVGCGTGDDVRALAGRVGPTGMVVGVDISRALIAEARARCSSSVAVQFLRANAAALPFADHTFQGARVDRVLQHVAEPMVALVELRRVVRPGGVVVVSEPDWETLVINSPDRTLTRSIVHTLADAHIRNGWMGRQVPGILAALGLVDVEVHPVTLPLRSYVLAAEIFSLPEAVETAGAPTEQKADWLADLQNRDARGEFFAALTGFTVAGRVP
jgi:SAM-dependent methyltransferase